MLKNTSEKPPTHGVVRLLAMCHPSSLLLSSQVRIAVENELFEERPPVAVLYGDVEFGAQIQIPPPLLAPQITVHDTEGTAGHQYSLHLVKYMERQSIHGASLVTNIGFERESAEVTGAVRVVEQLLVGRDVSILFVSTKEYVTVEPPRVAVRHGLATPQKFARKPDVQLDGLEVGRAGLDDKFGLEPRNLGMFDVRDQRPVLAGDEPLPGEHRHLGRCDFSQPGLRQFVHFLVQYQIGRDEHTLHEENPLFVSVGTYSFTHCKRCYVKTDYVVLMTGVCLNKYKHIGERHKNGAATESRI